jgi:hypothetical protein
MYKDNLTDTGYKIHPGKVFEYEFLDVTEEHGSCFVAICFVSHMYPNLLKPMDNFSKTKKYKK